MRKLLLLSAAILALGVSPAYAQHDDSRDGGVDTSALSAEQVHQLQVQADQLKSQAPPVPTQQKLSEYAAIGKDVAEAVGEAAKQLNVAVNDFAKTPVGDLTIKLIVFKVLEARIVRTVLGLMWVSLFTPIWLHFYGKLWAPVVSEEFFENGKRKSRQKTPYAYSNKTDDEKRLVWFGAVLGMAGAVIGIFIFI